MDPQDKAAIAERTHLYGDQIGVWHRFFRLYGRNIRAERGKDGKRREGMQDQAIRGGDGASSVPAWMSRSLACWLSRIREALRERPGDAEFFRNFPPHG
jgi:hypothetical protein